MVENPSLPLYTASLSFSAQLGQAIKVYATEESTTPMTDLSWGWSYVYPQGWTEDPIPDEVYVEADAVGVTKITFSLSAWSAWGTVSTSDSVLVNAVAVAITSHEYLYIEKGDSVQLTASCSPAAWLTDGYLDWSIIGDAGGTFEPNHTQTQYSATETTIFTATACGGDSILASYGAQGTSATDSIPLMVLYVDLESTQAEDAEYDTGVYIAKGGRSPLTFGFEGPVQEMAVGGVGISKSDQLTLWKDSECQDQLAVLSYDFSDEAERAAFLNDVYNQTLYVKGASPSGTQREAYVRCTLSAPGASISDEVRYTVIHLWPGSDTIEMTVNDSVEIEAYPCPPYLPGVGRYFRWELSDGSDARGTFDPEHGSTAWATVFTATAAGTGGIGLTQYILDEPDYPETGVGWPLIVYGVGIHEPVVGVVGETSEFRASGYPEIDTYCWSILSGSNGAGTFDPNPTQEQETVFTGTAAGTGWVRVDYGTDHDTAPLVVLDVNITSHSSLSLEVGETCELQANAVPDPEDIGGWLAWSVDDGEAGGSFSPNWAMSESTVFTSTRPGTGFIEVRYSTGWKYASDTIPLTITGVLIEEPCVCVKGETTDFRADGYPNGDTYSWSIVAGSAASGSFDPNPTQDDETVFTGTAAGTGWVQVSYGEESDSAPLVVLDVDITSHSSLELEVGETCELQANAVPDPVDIGGWLIWSVDDGEAGGSFGPGWTLLSETTIFEATGAGTGYVVVDYCYGGEEASDSIPVAISGVTIDEPCVGVLGHPKDFRVTGYPPGDTFTWSIASGSQASGTFGPNPTQSDTTTFTGTAVGTGWVSVTYGSANDTAPLTVVALSLSTAKSTIMTGAKSDTVHQTLLTALVGPPGITGNVSFSLVDGKGEGRAIPASFNPRTPHIVDGVAQTVLTSSDAIEVIEVEASFMDASDTVQVTSGEADCEWHIDPPYLDYGSDASVGVVLTFQGDAVVGHSLTFKVVEVRLLTGELVDEALDDYAYFESPATVDTSDTGWAEAALTAGDEIGNCETIFVGVEDNGVWYYVQ